MASTGMFAPHWDLLAPPGQGMPKRWMKEPPGFRPQTSLRPLESFRQFLGLAPLPMAEPRVLGPSFVVRTTPAVPAGTRVAAYVGGGGCEISVSKSIRLGYKEVSCGIGFFF